MALMLPARTPTSLSAGRRSRGDVSLVATVAAVSPHGLRCSARGCLGQGSQGIARSVPLRPQVQSKLKVDDGARLVLAR